MIESIYLNSKDLRSMMNRLPNDISTIENELYQDVSDETLDIIDKIINVSGEHCLTYETFFGRESINYPICTPNYIISYVPKDASDKEVAASLIKLGLKEEDPRIRIIVTDKDISKKFLDGIILQSESDINIGKWKWNDV